MTISIKVKTSNESAFSISLENVESQTVSDLKLLISQKLENCPVESQRLIFAGKVLKDADVLSVYKLQEGNTIHLVRGKVAAKSTGSTESTASSIPAGPSSASTPAAPTAAASSTPTPTASTGSLPGGTVPPINFNPADPYGFSSFMSGMGGMGGASPFGATPGGGFGGMPAMGGLGVDPNAFSTLMSDPRVSAGIAQMMSNPQMMEMMINSDPQMARMMTPEARQMMQSEQFRTMLSNPQFIQSMLQMGPMLAAMRGVGGGGMPSFPGQAPASTPSTTNATTPNMTTPNPAGFPPLPMFNPALMSMLAGGAPGVTPGAPSRPPEELYATQLSQLQAMGFYDAAENVRALTMTGGNVEAAIEWLFSRPR